VKCHLHRLIELEYVLVHRAPRGQGVAYELCYQGEGQDGAPFLPGLLDVARLREPDASIYDGERSASAPEWSGVGRPPVGPGPGGGRSEPPRPNAHADTGDALVAAATSAPARNGRPPAQRSHVPATLPS
jgi:hypothetical protein